MLADFVVSVLSWTALILLFSRTSGHWEALNHG